MENPFAMVEIRDFTLPDSAKCLCDHTHAEHSVRPTPMAVGKCSICDCLTFMLDDSNVAGKCETCQAWVFKGDQWYVWRGEHETIYTCINCGGSDECDHKPEPA